MNQHCKPPRQVASMGCRGHKGTIIFSGAFSLDWFNFFFIFVLSAETIPGPTHQPRLTSLPRHPRRPAQGFDRFSPRNEMSHALLEPCCPDRTIQKFAWLTVPPRNSTKIAHPSITVCAPSAAHSLYRSSSTQAVTPHPHPSPPAHSPCHPQLHSLFMRNGPKSSSPNPIPNPSTRMRSRPCGCAP